MNLVPIPLPEARAYERAPEPPGRASEILHEAVSTIYRRRWVFAAAFLIVLIVGLVALAAQPRLYPSSAIIMVAPREPGGAATSPAAAPLTPDPGYVESQVEILRSPALTAQLIERLALYRDPEFGGSPDTSGATSAMIRRVSDAIEPGRRGSTYIVEILVKTKDPAKSARMANTLVDLYMESRARARIDAANRTRDWLSGRLRDLETELRRSETALQTFKAKAGLLSANGYSLAEQNLQSAEISALAAQVEQAEHDARWRFAQSLTRSGRTGDTMTGALASETMSKLRERETDINRRLAEYDERYGPLHPLVVQAQSEKRDVEKLIQAEVGRLTESLRNEAQISRVRSKEILDQVAQARGRLIASNGKLAELNALEREADSARAVYVDFKQRYEATADDAAGVGGDAQLIAAGLPATEPDAPSSLLLLIVIGAAGVMVGALAAFAVDRASDRIETPEEVDRRFGLPVLASIPHLAPRHLQELPLSESHPGGFAVARPKSAFTEAIRVLRSRIVRSRRERPINVVAVASALPREGKTTTALCLARVSAMAGSKVILVDCDLRGQSLNVLLGVEPERGILDVLRGECSWREVVGAEDFSGACVLPAAAESFTPEAVFDTEAMRGLLRELTREFDLVILDCPPVLTLAEARDIAVLADGVVIVARRGKTSALALRTAISELLAVGANIIGGALNGIDMSAPGRSSYADPIYFSHAAKSRYFA